MGTKGTLIWRQTQDAQALYPAREQVGQKDKLGGKDRGNRGKLGPQDLSFHGESQSPPPPRKQVLHIVCAGQYILHQAE